jgi:hypothetical protein
MIAARLSEFANQQPVHRKFVRMQQLAFGKTHDNVAGHENHGQVNAEKRQRKANSCHIKQMDRNDFHGGRMPRYPHDG